MYCGECGKEVNSSWSFCKSCGSEIGASITPEFETISESQEQPSTAVPVMNLPEQPQAKNSGSILAIVAIAVIAIAVLIVFFSNQNANQIITLDKLSVESDIQDQFKEQLVGADVDCPEIMQGKVGTEFRCVANFTDNTGVNIIVTITNSPEQFDWHSG